MANGPKKRGRGRLRSGSPSSYLKKILGRHRPSGRLKKILGMTQRPTQAGQTRFGDVDVMGAQTTAREQEKLERARMNERLGEAAGAARMNERLGAAAGAGLRGLVGAQFTEQERQRVRNLTGAQMTEAERRRLVREHIRSRGGR